ncbi:MAG: OsmC family protein [Desulfovibrio sp.]|nr:OsmC family protein [Desulfovibrio sp.]
MPTVSARYLGDLRVECTHNQSGTTIITDAPTDNSGKGEAFSPTDLCATALGACAMTIMGIYAQKHGMDLTGAEMEINKIMSADPRRIGKVEVVFKMPARQFSEKDKTVLERAARACPVHKSLHPDVEQVLTFVWQD